MTAMDLNSLISHTQELKESCRLWLLGACAYGTFYTSKVQGSMRIINNVCL